MEVFSDWIDGVGDQWAELEPDLTGMFLISGERAGYERSVVRWSASKQSGVVAVAYRAAGGDALEFDLSQLAPSRVVISKLDPVTGVKTTFASRTNTGIFTAVVARSECRRRRRLGHRVRVRETTEAHERPRPITLRR